MTSVGGRSGALQLLLIVFLLIGVLAAAYSMLFYAGPYRWLAEAQLRWFDAYYVSITVVLTLCLFVVPPLVAARVLVMGGQLAEDSALAALIAPGASAGLRARVDRAKFWLIVFSVGAGLVVTSLRDLMVAAQGKQLERVSLSALEQGKKPRGTWLELDGTLVWGGSLETEDRRERWTFVPVVSERWKPGGPVRALLRVPSDEITDVDPKALRGTLDWTGAPGVVRSGYRDGKIDIEDALLLDYGKSPAERAGASTIMIALGGVLALIGGAGSIVRLRRS